MGIVERSRSVVIERQVAADACSHAHALHLSFWGYLTADSLPSLQRHRGERAVEPALVHTMRNGCDKHGCAGSFGIRVRLVEQLVPHALCVLIGDDVSTLFGTAAAICLAEDALRAICRAREPVPETPIRWLFPSGRCRGNGSCHNRNNANRGACRCRRADCRRAIPVLPLSATSRTMRPCDFPDEPGKKYTYTGHRAREFALPLFPGRKCLFREYAPAE